MTDNWERRFVPYSPGYNNAPDDTPPVDLTPVINTFTYNTYYDDNDIAGNFSCANIATALAIPGVFFYASNLTQEGCVGIRLQTDTGNLFFRHDTNPEIWLGWDDGFAIVKHTSLTGRHIFGAMPIDSSNLPLSTPAVLDLQFYDVDPTDVGQETGDPTHVHIPFLTTATKIPTYVNVWDCGLNSFTTYYDPNGPNAGTNPGTATISQWDADGVHFADTALSTWQLDRIDVADDTGTGYTIYGNPLPTAAP